MLFDDIRADEVRLPDVLKWTDGYNFRAPIKGGTVDINATTFIFTSNVPPPDVWPGDITPLKRRLCGVIELLGGVPDLVCKKPGHGHGDGGGNTHTPPSIVSPAAAGSGKESPILGSEEEGGGASPPPPSPQTLTFDNRELREDRARGAPDPDSRDLTDWLDQLSPIIVRDDSGYRYWDA